MASILQTIVKYRLLRALFIFLFLVVPIGYFLFTVMFFNPFEGSARRFHDYAPSDVTFFVGKENLQGDFSEFPRPNILEALERTREWPAFVDSELYRELTGGQDPTDYLDQVGNQTRDVPVDILSDLVGKEIAIAGRTRAEGDFAWALMARVTSKVKFAYEAMSYGLVRSMASLPVGYEIIDGQPKVTLEDGSEIYLFRHLDMLVVSNDQPLLTSIESTTEDVIQSMGYTSLFNEGVIKPQEKRLEASARDDVATADRFEFLGQGQALIDSLGLTPEPAFEDDLGGLILQAVFDPSFLRTVAGSVDLSSAAIFGVDMIGELDSVSIKNADTGFYSNNELALEETWAFMGNNIPSKGTILAGAFSCNLTKLLRLVESKMSSDLLTLINDFLLDARNHSGALDIDGMNSLIDRLAEMLGDEIIFVLTEPQEWVDPATEEIGNITPKPRVGIIAPMKNVSIFRQFEQWLKQGVRSASDVKHMWSVIYPDGSSNEFLEMGVQELLDLEGLCFGMLSEPDENYFVFTTSSKLYESIIDVRIDRTPSIAADPRFGYAEPMAKRHGSLLLLGDIDATRRMYDAYADEAARAATLPNWIEIRKDVEASVLREFGLRAGQLSAPEQTRVDDEVDRRLIEQETRWISETVPREAEKIRKSYVWMDLFKTYALSLRAKDDTMSLSARLVTAVRRGG